MAVKSAKPKKDRKARETGTAGQSPDVQASSETLPPDPQTLGRPMTQSEKVDEASLESMDGSDPPSYMPTRSGGPKRPKGEQAGSIDEEEIRRRAYFLWEQEGQPSGRDEEYWHRAKQELQELASKRKP
jgi:hypothetical protein